MASDAADFVLATYPEIAQRFGLGSKRAARTKVKRAGWGHESANHPYDALRIRVPRSVWDQAQAHGAHEDNEPDAEGSQAHDAHNDHVAYAIGTKTKGIRRPKRRDTQDNTDRVQGRRKPDAKDIESVLKPVLEQLEREKARADGSDARVRELTDELLQAREGRGSALAKAAAAEARVDDLMAQIHDLTKGKTEAAAKVALLEHEIAQMKAQAGRRKRSWRFWRGR